MTREKLKEEFVWGVATLLAALLCVALLPVALPFILAERLGSSFRKLAAKADKPF